MFAIAREMKKEYEYIHRQGFVLQLDAPDLAMERTFLFQDRSLREFQEIVELHIAALNAAVEAIPAEQIRLHVCWGNYDGPTPTMWRWKTSCRSCIEPRSGAVDRNGESRHQHEHKAFEKHRLPDSMVLIPG